MKILLILVLLLSIIIESTLATIPLTLLLVVLISGLDPKEAGAFAFVGGVLLDFMSFRTLGQSSLFFLAIVILVHRVRRKYTARIKILSFFFLMGVYASYQYIFLGNVSFVELIMLSSVTVIVFFASRSLFPVVPSGGRLEI